MKFSILFLQLCSWLCLCLALFVCGCVSVPRIMPSQAEVDSQNGVMNTPPPSPNLIQKVFEPTKAAAMTQAAAKWQGPMPAAKPASSSSAIKATVSTTEHLLWVIGVACVLGAVACFWFGLYIPGAKLMAAGILLPIFATWFAYNYLWIVAIVLIGSAIGFLWAERNSALEKSIANAAYFEIQDAYKKLCAAVQAAGNKIETKL